MKHLLLLIIALLIGSTSIEIQAKSSPIKLSVLRKNTGKIVRTPPLDISSISAYIDEKYIQLDFSFLLNETHVSIYSEDQTLVYQETINSNTSHISIDISKWKNGNYSISFTDQSNISFIGNFQIK